jgi:hypothetical protein
MRNVFDVERALLQCRWVHHTRGPLTYDSGTGLG